MVHMLAKIKGIGIETADMLVHEVLSRKLRDERALGRYAGMAGSPNESGNMRREKGLARAGNCQAQSWPLGSLSPRREYRGEALAFRVPKWAETL